MEEKKNIWVKIGNFLKKGWTLLIVPAILFIVRFFINKDNKSEVKKEIKELEKEIKEEKKEIKEEVKIIEEKETELEKKAQEIKEDIKKQEKDQDQEILEILPGLKK